MRRTREHRDRSLGGKVELDLADAEAGPHCVDRHAQLAPEAAREREAGGSRPLAEIALPGQRLGCREAAAQADQRPRRLLRDPEASADAL